MPTLEENIRQAIADFDDIERAIEEMGVEVPDGTDTKEYGNLIRAIKTGEDSPVKYVVSPDADGNTVLLRDLDSGSYVLNGSFKPFYGSNTICRFSSDLLVNVVKGTLQGVPTSHIQIFYPVHNVVQFVEVTEGTYKKTDVKLNDLAYWADVEELIASATKANQEQYANALKATASGEVVRVDDVSPIEHTAKVSVRGRNLFDISKVPITGGSTKISVTEVGTSYIVVTSESGYNSNGFCSTGVTLLQLCPQLKEGDEVTLTAESPSIMNCFYLDTAEIADSATRFWHFGNGRVITKEMLNAVVCVYGLNAIQGDGVGECTISNIQIKDSNAATEYEPYIDPATVTLTRCGKAVFSREEVNVEKAETSWASVLVAKVPVPNGNYVASCKFNQVGTDKSQVRMSIRRYDDYSVTLGGAYSTAISGVLEAPFKVEEGGGFQIYLYSNYTSEVLSTECLFENLIVEVGDVATEYEPYNGENYTPATDGTCEVVSVAPTMTLLTDTSGVNIEVEYNQDANKAMDDVRADIRALDDAVAKLASQTSLVDSVTGKSYRLYVSDGKLMLAESEG